MHFALQPAALSGSSGAHSRKFAACVCRRVEQDRRRPGLVAVRVSVGGQHRSRDAAAVADRQPTSPRPCSDLCGVARRVRPPGAASPRRCPATLTSLTLFPTGRGSATGCVAGGSRCGCWLIGRFRLRSILSGDGKPNSIERADHAKCVVKRFGGIKGEFHDQRLSAGKREPQVPSNRIGQRATTRKSWETPSKAGPAPRRAPAHPGATNTSASPWLAPCRRPGTRPARRYPRARRAADQLRGRQCGVRSGHGHSPQSDLSPSKQELIDRVLAPDAVLGLGPDGGRQARRVPLRRPRR
jgi:hypothetical protein